MSSEALKYLRKYSLNTITTPALVGMGTSALVLTLLPRLGRARPE